MTRAPQSTEASKVSALNGPTILIGLVLLSIGLISLFSNGPVQEIDGELGYWRPKPLVLAKLEQTGLIRLGPRTWETPEGQAHQDISKGHAWSVSRDEQGQN
jgi:hypothetical protein